MSQSYLTGVLDALEARQGPSLLESGPTIKVTLQVGAYDLYLLERMSGPVGYTREEFALHLLRGALSDAGRHSLGLSLVNEQESDIYIEYVETARVLEVKLAAMRRAWKLEYIEAATVLDRETAWRASDQVELNVEAAVEAELLHEDGQEQAA
jgi:hypothetical protein